MHHLRVNRIVYSHHALSIDGYWVIQYQDGIVKAESIESFAKEASLHILDTPQLYTRDKVIAHAIHNHAKESITCSLTTASIL